VALIVIMPLYSWLISIEKIRCIDTAPTAPLTTRIGLLKESMKSLLSVECYALTAIA
jgi:hypothetical protein